MRKSIHLALVASVMTVSASGEGLGQPAAVPTESQSALPGDILPARTEVHLRLRTGLNSRRSRVGDLFELYVTDPVAINGVVVIPAGSPAIGEVMRVRRRASWGRRGILETRLSHVWVGDRQIRLTGMVNDRGRPGANGIVAATLLGPVVLAPVYGFVITGTSAEIPRGTAMVAYTEEDVQLPLAPTPEPEPLTEPATGAPD